MRAITSEFDDTVVAGLLGLQLEFVRVLLIRLQAAGSTDLPLLYSQTGDSARHGGASITALKKLGDADVSVSTVSRQQTHPGLARQVSGSRSDA